MFIDWVFEVVEGGGRLEDCRMEQADVRENSIETNILLTSLQCGKAPCLSRVL